MRDNKNNSINTSKIMHGLAELMAPSSSSSPSRRRRRRRRFGRGIVNLKPNEQRDRNPKIPRANQSERRQRKASETLTWRTALVEKLAHTV